MRRMTARGRGEEGGVSLEYLDNLHTKHEEWLHTGTLRREDMELLSDPSRNRVSTISSLWHHAPLLLSNVL